MSKSTFFRKSKLNWDFVNWWEVEKRILLFQYKINIALKCQNFRSLKILSRNLFFDFSSLLLAVKVVSEKNVYKVRFLD